MRKELKKSKVRKLRKKGFIPSVVYSKEENIPIKISYRDFLQLMHQYHLETKLINLNIKENAKTKTKLCLIKEIQYHHIEDEIIHIDFNEVLLTQTIKIKVPLVAQGEPLGVKQGGGSLEHLLWELEVECLPTQIPKEISVDVSSLKIGDNLCVKDIKPIEGVKIINDPETIIFTVSAPIKEEAIISPTEEVPQQPEAVSYTHL
ncbi:MAG: 50S ribosomal protein L25, partial [Candidatus Omnitrophica bacterium]|nr:50S ribosomal protein L25 [Candidatus Omnitrophota bacterium]